MVSADTSGAWETVTSSGEGLPANNSLKNSEQEQRLDFLQERIALMQSYVMKNFNTRMTSLTGFLTTEYSGFDKLTTMITNHRAARDDFVMPLMSIYDTIKSDIESGIIPSDTNEDKADFSPLVSITDILYENGEFAMRKLLQGAYEELLYENPQKPTVDKILGMVSEITPFGRIYRVRIHTRRDEFIQLAGSDPRYQDSSDAFDAHNSRDSFGAFDRTKLNNNNNNNK